MAITQRGLAQGTCWHERPSGEAHGQARRRPQAGPAMQAVAQCRAIGLGASGAHAWPQRRSATHADGTHGLGSWPSTTAVDQPSTACPQTLHFVFKNRGGTTAARQTPRHRWPSALTHVVVVVEAAMALRGSGRSLSSRVLWHGRRRLAIAGAVRGATATAMWVPEETIDHGSHVGKRGSVALLQLGAQRGEEEEEDASARGGAGMAARCSRSREGKRRC